MAEQSNNGVSKAFGVVVLAAGESSRMGQPKQLLPMGMRCLLDLTLELVATPEIEHKVIVLGANAQAIRDSFWMDEFEIVENPDWQKGMVTSVQAGLARIEAACEWVLIFLCDYPLVHRESVTRLLLRASTSSEEIPIIAPAFYGKSGHPILLHRQTFRSVLNLTSEVGLDAAVQAFKPDRVLVEVDDPGIHFDVDTPEDYQRAQQYWAQREQLRNAKRELLSGGENAPKTDGEAGCSAK